MEHGSNGHSPVWNFILEAEMRSATSKVSSSTDEMFQNRENCVCKVFSGIYSPNCSKAWCRLTTDQLGKDLPPGVPVLAGKDPNRFLIRLLWGVANHLQLSTKLISGQWCRVTIVHIQHEELMRARQRRQPSQLDLLDPRSLHWKFSYFLHSFVKKCDLIIRSQSKSLTKIICIK